MPGKKHKRQKRDNNKYKQVVPSGHYVPREQEHDRHRYRQRSKEVVLLLIWRPVEVRPCPPCLLRASVQVLPELRRTLLQASYEVDKHFESNDGSDVTNHSQMNFVVPAGFAALILTAFLFGSGQSTEAAIVFAFLAAGLLLVAVEDTFRRKPSAKTIFGGARITDMENTWGVFSRGRDVMNQALRLVSTPTPSLSTSRSAAHWSRHLARVLADILTNLYAGEEEILGLNKNLNDVIRGAMLADVIDASIQCRERSEGGEYGDLLRDFAAVCQLIINGDF